MDDLIMAVGATRMRWPKDQAQQSQSYGGGMTQDMKLMEFAFRMGQGCIQPPAAPSTASAERLSSRETLSSRTTFPVLGESQPLPIMDDPNRSAPQELGRERKHTYRKRCDR